MGRAFELYLDSLRERNRVQAEQYASDRAMQRLVMQELYNRMMKEREVREQQLREEGLYKLRAREMGVYQPVKDYELEGVRRRRSELESVKSRADEVNKAIAGIDAQIAAVEARGDEKAARRELARLQKERVKYERELERNRKKQEMLAAEIESLRSSPDYMVMVENEQWNNFLRQNPFYSETYYRVMAKPQEEVEEKKTEERRTGRGYGGEGEDIEDFRRRVLDSLSKTKTALLEKAIEDINKYIISVVYDSMINAISDAKSKREINQIFAGGTSLESQILDINNLLYDAASRIIKSKSVFDFFRKGNRIERQRMVSNYVRGVISSAYMESIRTKKIEPIREAITNLPSAVEEFVARENAKAQGQEQYEERPKSREQPVRQERKQEQKKVSPRDVGQRYVD